MLAALMLLLSGILESMSTSDHIHPVTYNYDSLYLAIGLCLSVGLGFLDSLVYILEESSFASRQLCANA